jgi:hypothetical protein
VRLWHRQGKGGATMMFRRPYQGVFTLLRLILYYIIFWLEFDDGLGASMSLPFKKASSSSFCVVIHSAFSVFVSQFSFFFSFIAAYAISSMNGAKLDGRSEHLRVHVHVAKKFPIPTRASGGPRMWKANQTASKGEGEGGDEDGVGKSYSHDPVSPASSSTDVGRWSGLLSELDDDQFLLYGGRMVVMTEDISLDDIRDHNRNVDPCRLFIDLLDPQVSLSELVTAFSKVFVLCLYIFDYSTSPLLSFFVSCFPRIFLVFSSLLPFFLMFSDHDPSFPVRRNRRRVHCTTDS